MEALGEVRLNEDMVVTVNYLFTNLFNPIAYFNISVLKYNMELASEGGLSESDRTVDSSVADFLIDHFGTLYSLLISNEQFRTVTKSAVHSEIMMSDLDGETVKSFRDQTKSSKYRTSLSVKRPYVIDFSSYNEVESVNIFGRCADSMKKFGLYGDVIEDAVHNLSGADLVSIGYVISNFMYFLMAVAKNESYLVYMKSMVEEAENIVFGSWETQHVAV